MQAAATPSLSTLPKITILPPPQLQLVTLTTLCRQQQPGPPCLSQAHHPSPATASAGHADSPVQAAATGSTIPVALDSLQGRFLVLTLQKRPGFEDADVLDAPLPPSGGFPHHGAQHNCVRHVQGQVQGAGTGKLGCRVVEHIAAGFFLHVRHLLQARVLGGWGGV